MINEFTVDLSTGILTANEDVASSCDLINGETDLLIDYYGSYSLVHGNVWLNDSGFVQPGRTITARGTVTFKDGRVVPLTAEDIVKFQISWDIGNPVPIGATPSASFSISLANTSGEWDYLGQKLRLNTFDSAIIRIQAGALGENVYEYADLGQFVAFAVSNQEHEPFITVTGADYMSCLMMNLYTDFASYPQTYGDIFTLACTQAGVIPNLTGLGAYATEAIGSAPSLPENTTCRNIVGWIAMLCGGNACINIDGECAVIPIVDTSKDINADVYKKLTVSIEFPYDMNYAIYLYEYDAPPGTAPLEHIVSSTADGSYYIMDIKGNPFLAYGWANQDILDDVISLVGEWIRTRSSARIEWQGDDSIKIGDTMNVTRANGNSIKIGVLQHTISFSANGLRYESGCDLAGLTLSGSYRVYR